MAPTHRKQEIRRATLRWRLLLRLLEHWAHMTERKANGYDFVLVASNLDRHSHLGPIPEVVCSKVLLGFPRPQGAVVSCFSPYDATPCHDHEDTRRGR